jgi:hypothetical protein
MLRTALAEAAETEVAPHFAMPASQAAVVARDLVERYGDGQEPRYAPDALQALLRRIRLAQYDWENVVPADRLHVAWVLWEGHAPPAEHESFLRDYLEWLEAPNRRHQIVRLALAWTAAFDPALSSIATIGDWLAAHAAALHDPWPHLAAEFDIFSHANGPTALAEAFLGSDETTAEFFARIKLPTRATSGGLILETLSIAAAATAHWAPEDPRLALRLCALGRDGDTFRPDAVAAKMPERAAALRVAIAEALLLPWENLEPPAAVKEPLIAFLLHHYGDVRVAPQLWASLSAAAENVMRRWLMEKTIASYFRLAAQSKTADRARLIERQEFWLSRIDQIDGAWLLAGPQSVAALGAGPQLAHGRLGGFKPDHAALLLRVGELTVLESSHESSEAIWLQGNPFAPALYRPASEIYWPRTLSNSPDYSSAYSASGSYNWQERLASFFDRT